MKTFLKLIAAAWLLTLTAAAQYTVIVQPTTANAVSNYLSGRYTITELKFSNGSSSNNATLKFYDWATAATNVIRAAYTSYTSYQTNWNVAYTNSAGIVATNTFSGWYSLEVSNAAVTNEQTRLATITVGAGKTDQLLPITPIVARGLTLLPDQAGTLQITYRSN